MKKIGLLLLYMVILILPNCTTGNAQKSDPGLRIVEQTVSSLVNGQIDITGNDGAGLTLTVLAPQGKNLGSDDSDLPDIVLSTITSGFTKFSKIDTVDWQSRINVWNENERLEYKEDSTVSKAGEVPHTQYILQGDITKTGAGYLVDLKITDTQTNTVNKAAHNKIYSKEQLEDTSGAKAATADLLVQMGVKLTAEGEEELRAVKDAERQSDIASAKGVIAERNGNVVEALSYYITSASYDPSSVVAASRLNILQADITSGNMGQNVRNDIQWRNQWIARLTEAEQFFTVHTKQPIPYSIVYSANLQQGSIDYTRETVDISGITIDLIPNAMWFLNAPMQVIDVVREGLLATGRSETWGINWPRNSIVSGAFSGRNETFSVVVELLNDRGVSLGSQSITLQGGWYVDSYSPFQIILRMNGQQKIGFSRVNANLISDNLSVRIKSIDGVDAARTARDKRITILTEADYVRLPEVIAGMDSRAMGAASQVFVNDGRGMITAYKGGGGAVVIPPYLSWKPVTGIGKEAFTFEIESTNFALTGRIFGGRGLTSVVIPNSVTSIGENAFWGNKLTGVVIPSGVTAIAPGAFKDNKLSNVVIPNGVTSIGMGAFSKNQLTNVVIPHGITTIGMDAFSENQLTGVVIPNSVTTIDANAFAKNNITSVVIPNSVKTFGRKAAISAIMYTISPGSSPSMSTTVIPYTELDGASYDVFKDNPLTSITLPAYLKPIEERYTFIQQEKPNQDGLFAFYYKNTKRAGVYTRPTADSKQWSYKKP
ncbi:hypothetical protein FACS1894147_02960 [Spirochaetia bacterium]|nr:hypothetical protein FACS1894147_02960 [Spirochaetia bacterium]